MVGDSEAVDERVGGIEPAAPGEARVRRALLSVSDKDGIVDEVSVGNMTALVAFSGMTRTPVQHARPGREESARRGERLFRGEGSPNIPQGSRMCAQCHTPVMTIEDPTFTIEDPVLPGPNDPCPTEAISPQTGKPKLPGLVDPDPPARHRRQR